jgi:AcrR family transcriptional regulator
VGRWGLSKTTIEDVAKEAGVSRATVYRLFPGGKNAIMQAAVLGEVRSLLAVLTVELAQVDQVEDCLTVAMHHSAQFLEQHQALSFMRDHESGLLDQLISAEQLDLLFVTAAQVMKPVLSRFMDEATAIKVGMWVARLVVSYVAEPSAEFDLCKEQDSRRLVRMFLLPGISTASLTRSPT